MNITTLKSAKQVVEFLKDYPQLTFVNNHKHDRYIRNIVTGECRYIGVISRTRVETLKNHCEELTISLEEVYDIWQKLLTDIRQKRNAVQTALDAGEVLDYYMTKDYNITARRLSNARKILGIS